MIFQRYETKSQGPPDISMCVTVDTVGGLHARPAGRIVQTVQGAIQGLNATVVVCYKDSYADALSVIELMALSVPQGGELLFRAHGPDAHEAFARIVQLCTPHEKGGAWPEPYYTG